jgi:hypothetical protein
VIVVVVLGIVSDCAPATTVDPADNVLSAWFANPLLPVYWNVATPPIDIAPTATVTGARGTVRLTVGDV